MLSFFQKRAKCTDCRWSRDTYDGLLCTNPRLPYHQTWGMNNATYECADARACEGQCGKMAQFFVPKEGVARPDTLPDSSIGAVPVMA